MEKGMNDGQIARELGLTPKAIWSWRHNHCLPANETAGWKR